jgi:uncharacterized membrane protein YkoI
MKNQVMLLIVMMISLTLSTVYAQEVEQKDVPEAVKTSFQKECTTAKEVEWEKEGSNYEVEFEMNKTEYSVLFDDAGSKLETEMEITTKELPKAVSEYVKTTYKKTVKEAAKSTDANGVITYEVEIKGMDLIFDKDGKFIKEEKEDKKDKE